jgi:hypothetical protein|tara:strand:+ start:465 stop:911 length:447 start_codon:yes stop_codon:yes gene_type:complete
MKSIQTRNQTYRNIAARIPAKRKRIYEIITSYTAGITAQQISDRYNIPINQITGRITELKDMCFIKEHKMQLNDVTLNYCTSYKAITDNEELIEITSKKYVELVDKRSSLITDHFNNNSNHTNDFIKKELAKIERRIKQLGETQKLAS